MRGLGWLDIFVLDRPVVCTNADRAFGERSGKSRNLAPYHSPLAPWDEGWGSLGGGEERSGRLGVRSTHRHQIWRICLNEENAVNAASYAPPADREHRSAVAHAVPTTAV